METKGRTAEQKRDSGDSRRESALTVYVASPLGFAESTQWFLHERLIPAIEKAGAKAHNPWDIGSEMQNKIDDTKRIADLHARRTAWRKVLHLLGRANAEAIERSDAIVAVLDGVDVDSGTAAEIGYGAALKKWIIGYRGDFRRTGEDETAEVNLQVEYFIRENQGEIVHSLAELENILRGKAKERTE